MDLTRRAARVDRPGITLAVLAISTCGYSLAATQLLPAVPHLQSRFGSSPGATAWVFTAYMLVAAPATPLAGRMGDMYGRRRMLISVLAIFSVASVCAAIASNLPELIACRALQGLGGSILPLAFGTVRDLLPRRQVPVGIALVGAMTAVGGSVGLPLGGFVVQHAPVSVIFWTATGFGLLGLVGTTLFIPDTSVRAPGRLDLLGAGVLAAGLVTPLIGVSFGPAWGWLSPRTLGLLAVGVVVLPLWWLMQARRSTSLIDTASLSRRPVAATILTTLVMGFCLFGTFSMLPRLAQSPVSVGGLGFDAFAAGALMLPTAFVNAAVAPLVGLIGRAHGSRAPLLVGCFIAAGGLAWLSARHASALEIALGCALLGIGFAAAMAAGPNIIIGWAPREQTGAAIAANTLAQNLGSSIGSQVGVSIVVSKTAANGSISNGYTWAFGIAAAAALGAVALAALTAEPDRLRSRETELSELRPQAAETVLRAGTP